MTTVKTVKGEVRELLDQLPDDITLEDVQYHLSIRQRVKLGLDDVAAGRLVGQHEVEQRMRRWTEL